MLRTSSLLSFFVVSCARTSGAATKQETTTRFSAHLNFMLLSLARAAPTRPASLAHASENSFGTARGRGLSGELRRYRDAGRAIDRQPVDYSSVVRDLMCSSSA